MSKTVQKPFHLESRKGVVISTSFGGTKSSVDFQDIGQDYSGSVFYGNNYVDWRYRLINAQQCTTQLNVDVYTGRTGYLYSSLDFRYKLGSPLSAWTQSQVTYGSGQQVSTAALAFDANLLNDADNKAKAQFVQKLKATRSQFMGGVFLGELRETVRMIRHPAEALQRGLHAYLRTVRNRTVRIGHVPIRKRMAFATRVISDTWLEYALGVRPLLYDIQTGAKALADMHGQLHGEEVKAAGKSEKASTSKSTFSPYSNVFYDVQETTTERAVAIYRGYVRNELGTQKVPALLGFRPEEILPTIWELIPYSFVSDYFVNLGDIIECASVSLAGVSWMARTFVQEKRVDDLAVFNRLRTLQAWGRQDATQWDMFASAPPWQSYLQRRKIDRTPYTGSLIPSLRFYYNLRPTQWVTTMALLFSQSNRESRRLTSLIPVI